MKSGGLNAGLKGQEPKTPVPPAPDLRSLLSAAKPQTRSVS